MVVVISSKMAIHLNCLEREFFILTRKKTKIYLALVEDAIKSDSSKDYKEFIAMYHDWEKKTVLSCYVI